MRVGLNKLKHMKKFNIIDNGISELFSEHLMKIIKNLWDSLKTL